MTKEEALMTMQAIPESFWEKLSDTENKAVEMAVNALKGQKWIPFTMRECDEEEKEVYGQEYIMSCELPDDGDEIIVTYKWGKGIYVETDIFMNDVDGCYLESGNELVTEAIAWMPFPEPYKGE